MHEEDDPVTVAQPLGQRPLLISEGGAGRLGGKVGISPRVFLKKLVGDVLDRVDQFADFNPRVDYKLTVTEGELTEVERNARAATSVDDIDLALDQ